VTHWLQCTVLCVPVFLCHSVQIWEQYGMHRIEIFLRTIDEINRNETLLPNITLGCDIRDSCWYPPVALEQSIDFIKNSIASMEHKSRAESKEASGACSQNRASPIAGLIGPGSSTVTVQVGFLLLILLVHCSYRAF